MPNQPKTKGRTVRVDDDTWAAVEAEAKRTGAKASDVVRKALRKHLGLALVALVALVLAGCGGTAQAVSEARRSARPVVSAPAKFTAEAAREYAAIGGGTPLHTESHWACDQPMHISVAAPDGFEEQAYKSLDYTVAYLQALGYDVGTVGPTDYRSDITDIPDAGTVLVVVAPYHQDQSALEDNTGNTEINGADTRSALIFLDGSRRGLDPDTVLHEFGHVLGLDHRDVGSVMDPRWGGVNSGHFDADETATIACR